MKELKYSWSRVLLYMLFTLCHDCKWNTLSTFQNESLKISGHWWISIKVQMTWAFDKLKPASIWDCGYFFILTFMTFWQNFVTSSMLRIWHELLKYENKTEAISSTSAFDIHSLNSENENTGYMSHIMHLCRYFGLSKWKKAVYGMISIWNGLFGLWTWKGSLIDKIGPNNDSY